MPAPKRFDLVILGSGSTAFAAALRAQELGKTSVMTEERVFGGTCRHEWPGNVREIENALERALIVAGEAEILPIHLAPATGSRARGPDDLLVEGFALDAHERALVHAALERAGGNKTNAAKLLGITRRRLYSLLASFGASETNDS